jgi:hypothetical protein
LQEEVMRRTLVPATAMGQERARGATLAAEPGVAEVDESHGTEEAKWSL